MNPIICAAIRNRRTLQVLYHGYTRVVEPHIYGVDTRGDELLSCYQLSGGSASGEDTGWKSLKGAQLSDIRTTSRHFRPRAEFRPGDKVMKEIYCEIYPGAR